MSDLLPIILKDTFTLTRINLRLRTIKEGLLKYFFAGGNKVTSAPPQVLQQFNKDNVYKIFEDLEDRIKTLPVLTLYLSFEPDNETTYQIGSFARKLFNPSILLDIKLDPSVIAGCALVWKGVKRDYSLRARLEEKKGEILENFKKFLR